MCSNEFELCKLSRPVVGFEQKSVESMWDEFDKLPTPATSNVGLRFSDLTNAVSFSQCDIPRSDWITFVRFADGWPKLIELFKIVDKCAAFDVVVWLPLSFCELFAEPPFEVRLRPNPFVDVDDEDVAPDDDSVKLFPMLVCCDVILWLLNSGSDGCENEMDVDVLSGRLFDAGAVLHWLEFALGPHCLEKKNYRFTWAQTSCNNSFENLSSSSSSFYF